MRRLVIPMIIFAAMVCGVFGGLTLAVQASNLEIAEGVRYKFLNNPQMLVADETYMYVVSENTSTFKLFVFNKHTLEDRYPALPPIDIGFTPLEIGIAKGYLFLFEEFGTTERVHIFDTQDINATPIIRNLPSVGTGASTAFHVATIEGPIDNEVRIYFARLRDVTLEPTFWHVEFFTGSRTLSEARNPISPQPHGAPIVSLAANPNGNVYSLTGVGMISRNAAPLRNTGLIDDPRSLNYVGGRLVFIAGSLHSLSTSNPATIHTVPLNPDNQLGTETSVKPIFVFALSPNDVYVIDMIPDVRKNITRHRLLPNGSLQFSSIVAAVSGNDNGFHFMPSAIAVIDENRYVVADMVGLKLIDMSRPSGQQVIPFENRLPLKPTILDVVFDGWELLYVTIFDISNEIHRFKIPPSNVVTNRINYDKLITDENSVPKRNLTNALGENIDINQTRILAGTADTVGTPIPSNFPNVTNHARWSLCRASGRVFYIAPNHAIRSFQIQDYWSPLGTYHLNWRSGLVEFSFAEQNLFRQTTLATTLFEYPNAISPRRQVTAGTRLIIISDPSRLYLDAANTTPAHSGTFNWSMVLHNGSPFYVANTNLESVNFATTNIGFRPENDANRARVLLNNQPLYKFPHRDPSIIVGRLNRNFALSDTANRPGLIINRRILIEDFDGRTFFEVLVNENARPTSTGIIGSGHTFVAYIETSFVVDSFAPARQQNFFPNARIVIPRSIRDQGGLHIYSEVDNTGKGIDPFGNELVDEYGVTFFRYDRLRHQERIRVVGPVVRGGVTAILYFAYGESHAGYVDSQYIVLDGITPWQIVAIVASITSVCIIGYIVFKHFRRRKNRLQVPELV